MPQYIMDIEVLKSLWPIPATAFTIALVFAFFVGRRGERREFLFVILAFSMLGMVTGYLGGFSKSPVLSTLLPAVLSLLGGLVVHIIGKDTVSRIIVSISMFTFALTLLIGTEWGSVMRRINEEYYKSEYYLKKQAVIEFRVNDFRKNLNLPPLPVSEVPNTNTPTQH